MMTYELFWDWFKENEQRFFNIVKSKKNVVEDFFEELDPKIKAINEHFFFLTGMCEENIAELVITPDGIIKEFVFVEEFIAKAPQLPNWKFTALKPSAEEVIELVMYDYHFGKETLAFYATQDKNYPDNIDITIVYKGDVNSEEKENIEHAIYIYLDNYLGELYFATIIDNLDILLEKENSQELIPIEKLKSYLIWREKEFVEKYENFRYNTNEDSFTLFEGTNSEGDPVLASVNRTLLDWEGKPSHCWILEIIIYYEGDRFPTPDINDLMYNFEDEICEKLKSDEGYLYIGRRSSGGERTIFFACTEFKESSKITKEIIEKYNSQLEISYDFYKDKYWCSFDAYRK